MNKLDILALLESEKKTILKKINDVNSTNIIGLFEASGLMRKDEPINAPKAVNEKAPTRSKRPDIMEMDARSNGGVFDMSVKEDKAPSETQKPNKESDVKKPANEAKHEKNTKEPETKESVNEPTSNNNNNNIVDMSSGYPEIQLTEQLKSIDEKNLDNILTKSELDSILTADNDVKVTAYRNLLLIKKTDIGGSSKYDCFTTGKGGTKVVKGTVPDTYLSKYYTQKTEIKRPNTSDMYVIFASKLNSTQENLKYMVLPNNNSKYIVFTSDSNNNSEYITVLDMSTFDMLFHKASND